MALVILGTAFIGAQVYDFLSHPDIAYAPSLAVDPNTLPDSDQPDNDIALCSYCYFAQQGDWGLAALAGAVEVTPIDEIAGAGKSIGKQLVLPGFESFFKKDFLRDRLSTLPRQVHHILTVENEKAGAQWTLSFKEIADRYGLNLEGTWNRIPDFPHYTHGGPSGGGHPDAYHRWLSQTLRTIEQEAKGDRELFLELFDQRIRQPLEQNPEMLVPEWWQ